MNNIVYIACSLDGFIARSDGSLDWLMNIPNSDNSDYGFSDFLKSIDAIIMGRKTFETVKKFESWPYSQPVFVLSNSMRTMESKYEDKASIVNGSISDIVDKLRQSNLNNLYIDGGQTIQSFLRRDMIDEMIITTVPIILGNGIALFGNIGRELNFEIINCEQINNTLIQARYKRRNRTIAST